MSVGTFIDQVKKRVRGLHRRAYSEPTSQSWAQEENIVRFNRSRSLIYIGDLPVYEEMAEFQVRNLINNGEIPKFNEVADSLANAQIWHQPKNKKDEWCVTSLQAAHCSKMGSVPDPHVPQVSWDKFRLSRARGLSCKEAILWQITEDSGPLKVRTLIMLDDVVFTKLRETHQVEAPNFIQCIEEPSQEPEGQGDLTTSGDEVFDRAAAEPETAQELAEPDSPRTGKVRQKIASPLASSTSILERRGKVATPEEKNQCLKEALGAQEKKVGYSPRLDVGLMAKLSFFWIC